MNTTKTIQTMFLMIMMISIVSIAIPVKAMGVVDASVWPIYTDPHYGFSISYPPDWMVIPRPEEDGMYGGVLTFASGSAQVVVGVHTIERGPAKSLSKWMDEYIQRSTTFTLEELMVEKASEIPFSKAEGGLAYVLKGTSPITPFQIINLPRGRTVWFIWTNMKDQSLVYDQMVASFRFSEKTPRLLSEAFGSVYRPQPREQSLVSPSSLVAGDPTPVSLPDSTFYAPIPLGTKNFGCGSSAHTGLALMAVDIYDPLNTSVYSTHRSWVDFAGWDSTGYGNLIKANTDSLYSQAYLVYYAHLNTISVSVGQEIGTATLIAKSGNTGNSDGAHLHFHIRTSSYPVDLRRLRTSFSPNTYYPSHDGVNHSCGSMTR